MIRIDDKTWIVASASIWTIAGGNHFVEIQEVAESFNDELAVPFPHRVEHARISSHPLATAKATWKRSCVRD